jgi:hypothetical protein
VRQHALSLTEASTSARLARSRESQINVALDSHHGIYRGRPDRRDKPRVQRLLICTDPALSAPVVISGYAKRWAVESLFKNLKHGFGLKDAWQQSRQALMRWVTVLAAGYVINQMLAFTDTRRAWPAWPSPPPGALLAPAPPG